MATPQVLTEITLSSLPKLTSGKVRDLYALSPTTLLFVTTDRISAYDVILTNGVPHKGTILTLLSAHWFHLLPTLLPDLRTHFVTLTPPAAPILTAPERALVHGRSMTVRKLRIFPLEAIVRGYLTGSAWTEYQRQGTVHGIPVPAGMKQCAAFPSGPIYTPSTKAELGAHDENISPARAAEIVGADYGPRIEALALAIYSAAAAYARERGIIIADTKFEFGVDEATDEIVLVDEVLTPDSSRFWAVEGYETGREQESFDKQFLRDWLTEQGLKGKEGVAMPEEIARRTGERYLDAFRRLTGKTLEEAVGELDG